MIQNLRPRSGAASARFSVNLTRVGWNTFSLNIICQIYWSRSLKIGLQPFFKKESERCHFSWSMAFFHKNRGFLINYLHVLCGRMIIRHSQIKSKPILERRMIALINERHILMITYTFYAEKWQSIEKNWSKIHFFLKSLSSPSSRDLDQDIWQIIFKLNLFRRTLVRFTLSLAEAAPEGGRKFWITL